MLLGKSTTSNTFSIRKPLDKKDIIMGRIIPLNFTSRIRIVRVADPPRTVPAAGTDAQGWSGTRRLPVMLRIIPRQVHR